MICVCESYPQCNDYWPNTHLHLILIISNYSMNVLSLDNQQNYNSSPDL